MTVFTNVETIDPRDAKRLLMAQDERTHRPLKERVVERYTGEMLAGRWRLNGEAIVLNGMQILDGRHRLAACVRSDRPLETVVVRGVAAECFATIDQGVVRSPGDAFHIAGYKNASITAATARYCYLYDTTGTWSHRGGRTTSRQVLLDYVCENPWVAEAARFITGRKDRVLTSPSVTCAVYALCHNRPVERDIFFGDLLSGANLPAGSTCLMLRDRLAKDRRARLHRLQEDIQAAMMIKAWNAELLGKRVERLSYRPGTERFPHLVNYPPAKLPVEEVTDGTDVI